jgi:EAL domain-containing protein (putative c-di-GMP-specific phosphodiesterase class I)
VEQDELRLFLQPKMALATGAVVGAEALVRWQHPSAAWCRRCSSSRSPSRPASCASSRCGCSRLRAQVASAAAALGVLRVSVNLSTRDLLDLELPQRLEAILARLGVPASAFCLEITESAIMDDPQRAEPR